MRRLRTLIIPIGLFVLILFSLVAPYIMRIQVQTYYYSPEQVILMRKAGEETSRLYQEKTQNHTLDIPGKQGDAKEASVIPSPVQGETRLGEAGDYIVWEQHGGRQNGRQKVVKVVDNRWQTIEDHQKDQKMLHAGLQHFDNDWQYKKGVKLYRPNRHTDITDIQPRDLMDASQVTFVTMVH